MIDIHSHILPRIDDGSKSLSMTYEMLNRCVQNGTSKIIATPHYCDGYLLNINRIRARVKMLNKLIDKKGIPLIIYYGQEVYITENIIKDYQSKKIGTINDTHYMLMELSMVHFNERELNIIYELQLKGIKPIIAHPERYLYLIKNPRLINILIDEGYLFQLNAGSIEGIFGRKVKKTAEIFLKNNIYSFIGSDAHDNKLRTTDLSRGMNKIKSEQENEFIINAEKMLNDQEIEFKGSRILKRHFSFQDIFNIINKK